MSNEIMLVSLLFLGISFLVSAVLKSKFTKYSKIPLSSGLSGREIAEKMLRENGILDVKVISVEGFLSDHYNPANKTVNLSPDVYNGTSVSAAAVAAHECGHAVQHATNYGPLQFRSKMVPAVQISSMLVNWVLLAGMVLIATTQNPTVLLIGIVVMSVTVLFT
ncbi:MAG TPA: zinc metallopeptidase, partial [Chitinophagaceae bacterium]|nr:zinc metallopeptidase [Chitinophagaceae bacterium]